MEKAIKAADPDRWARYLLRRGQEVESQEEERAGHQSEPAVPPAVEDGKADEDDDEDGWRELFEGLDMDEGDSGSPGSVGSPSAPAPTATNGETMVEGSESRLLNRVVRCTQNGWEVEPDQRHADLIVHELDLKGANGVTTPGENGPRGKEAESNEELGPTEATR